MHGFFSETNMKLHFVSVESLLIPVKDSIENNRFQLKSVWETKYMGTAKFPWTQAPMISIDKCWKYLIFYLLNDNCHFTGPQHLHWAKLLSKCFQYIHTNVCIPHQTLWGHFYPVSQMRRGEGHTVWKWHSCAGIEACSDLDTQALCIHAMTQL